MKVGGKLGCHQIPERSFYYKKYQYPVCARCTGVLIGYIIGIGTTWIFSFSLKINILFILIMLTDWSIQYFNIYKSNNLRRLISGILCGYGLINSIVEGVKVLLSIV